LHWLPRKYFEHAGALLTADGTDDDKIKLESAPVGYKLVIPAPAPAGAAGPAIFFSNVKYFTNL
jgi:hypothetical protein